MQQMKYFDLLPSAAETELLKRGVMTDELLYCVKADLDGEGCYIDVYITFTHETLSRYCAVTSGTAS